MELVELQSRAGLDHNANLNATQDDLNEARKATGIKKKGPAINLYLASYLSHPTLLQPLRLAQRPTFCALSLTRS